MKTIQITIILITLFTALPLVALFAQTKQSYYKVTAFCHKKEGMSQQEFIDYVKEVHVPLALKMPGVKGYVQNFVSPEAENPPYDCYTELWFDSPEAMQNSYDSEAGKAALADVPNCLKDYPAIIGVEQVTLTEPVVSGKGFQDHTKMTFIAQKNPDLSWEEYQLFQMNQHAPKVLNGISELKGYEINFASEENAENPASAVVHVWFDNKAAMQKGFSGPIMASLKEDQNIMLKEPAIGVPILEYVVIPPPTYYKVKQEFTRK